MILIYDRLKYMNKQELSIRKIAWYGLFFSIFEYIVSLVFNSYFAYSCAILIGICLFILNITKSQKLTQRR